ncbi:MAG: autotransporter outer membrane beta-barrel domain-containing protein [Azonexaceae bacterium]|nr:autotransporter outer membrane beta-barrel domain-containing protein [Azonexaceae bacterium]
MAIIAGIVFPASSALALCNGNDPASCVLVSNTWQNENVRLVQRTINNRIELLIAKRQRRAGLSSGDETSPETSAYAGPSYSNSSSAGLYDGNTAAMFVGADRTLGESLVIGLGLGWSAGDINNATGGGLKTDAYTISPYLLYTLTDHLSIDASLGYSGATTKYETSDPGLGDGRQNSTSHFAAVNLTGSYWQNSWNLVWKLGYADSHVSNDAFAFSSGLSMDGSHARLGQVQASLMAAYRTDDWFPYVRATYENDVSRSYSLSSDKSGSVWAVGIRRIGLGALSLGVEANSVEGRPAKSNSLAASIAYRF